MSDNGMVVCVTMLHTDIVDDALDILANYTLGLDQYIPIRTALRGLMVGASVNGLESRALGGLESTIVVHLAILNQRFLSTDTGEESCGPVDPMPVMDRCFILSPTPVLRALCLHAWALSAREHRPWPIAWTRFVELVEAYEQETAR